LPVRETSSSRTAHAEGTSRTNTGLDDEDENEGGGEDEEDDEVTNGYIFSFLYMEGQ
jgi:hypothetical protein